MPQVVSAAARDAMNSPVGAQFGRIHAEAQSSQRCAESVNLSVILVERIGRVTPVFA